MTILLEELAELYPDFEYDAWLTGIDGMQFGSGFVGVNPNSKIPAMLHYGADGEPVGPAAKPPCTCDYIRDP